MPRKRNKKELITPLLDMVAVSQQVNDTKQDLFLQLLDGLDFPDLSNIRQAMAIQFAIDFCRLQQLQSYSHFVDGRKVVTDADRSLKYREYELTANYEKRLLELAKFLESGEKNTNIKDPLQALLEETTD